MNQLPTTPPGPRGGEDAGPGDVRVALEAVEAHLAGPPAGAAALPEAREDAGSLPDALAALDAAAQRQPEDAAALHARIDRARAMAALRTRRVPEGALEGVYEAVRARMLGASVADGERALLRANLSRTFLDAPRALALWRRTAIAAVALLAVGVGVWVGGAPADAPRAVDETAGDPRDTLLRPLTPMAADPARTHGGALDPRVLPMNGRVIVPGRAWDGGRQGVPVVLKPVRRLPPVERN